MGPLGVSTMQALAGFCLLLFVVTVGVPAPLTVAHEPSTTDPASTSQPPVALRTAKP